MLAEAVHSVADTSNQGLLLLGQKTAAAQGADEHPFGYGRNRYFYSFVVALVLFTPRLGVRDLRGHPQGPAPRGADVARSSRWSSW